MTRARLDARDGTERLSADDQATLHEEQLRDAAMLDHQRAAARVRSVPGLCSNCGSECLPAAVYCDSDCQQDHERRLQVQRRQGVAR